MILQFNIPPTIIFKGWVPLSLTGDKYPEYKYIFEGMGGFDNIYKLKILKLKSRCRVKISYPSVLGNLTKDFELTGNEFVFSLPRAIRGRSVILSFTIEN